MATDRWEQYYRHLRDISDPFATRLDTYGLRLMPLLAANDMKTTVDTGTVDKVIKLLDWQYHVRKAHDPIDAEDDIPKMEQRLRRCWAKDPDAEFKKWHLQPLVNYKRYGIRVFEWALNNLVQNGEVYHDTKKKTYILATREHSGGQQKTD